MRLLQVDTLSLLEFDSNDVPPYAILSHVWGDEEVEFNDIMNCTAKDKVGFRKITFCEQQAINNDLEYFWVDTCCIDKSSSAELSEAVNTMFDWYRNAARCYVYLSDVASSDPTSFEPVPYTSNPSDFPTDKILRDLKNSTWFTRSWTLPELLAPKSVEFFSMHGLLIGDKTSLLPQISSITGIPEHALKAAHQIFEYTIAERMAWAVGREASREEDVWYSLLGVLNIRMPLMYGEGKWTTYARLEKQISENEKRSPPNQLPTLSTRRPNQVYQSEEHVSKLPTLELEAVAISTTSETRWHDHEDLSTKIPVQPSYYRPLPYTGFRVFNLNPGKIGSAITGSIEECSLSEPPPYTALSYVWGQEPAIHRALINNENTPIRPNLYYALQRIRALQTVSIRLWVDSLCIDQSNLLERNAQVKEMAKVYNKADGVFIWLGEEDSTSKLAIELVNEIYEQRFHWTRSWREIYGFTALGQLLERPWFRRGWVRLPFFSCKCAKH